MVALPEPRALARYERTFEDIPAARVRVPLHICLTGPQKSGKTWSALELATGEQRVFGGDIFLIDTEEGRGNHYADYFKYRYVAFPPPHGPLDYLRAIEHCVKKGAGVVIVDSMTHEHSGVGGVMDQVEEYLDQKAGDNEHRRAQLTKNAHIKPKAQRKVLNRAIEQYGSRLAGIFCYRAEVKMSWPAGQDPIKLGWQPDTTSNLFYAMTAGFLLPPYSNGVPNFAPETEAERLFISLPEQFRGWFKPGMRLDADAGERMARWAMGEPARQTDRPGAGQGAEKAQAAGGQPGNRAHLEEINAVLTTHLGDDKAKRAEALRHAFGTSDRKIIASLSEGGLLGGIAALKMNLDPAAHMEREPGLDEGTEAEP